MERQISEQLDRLNLAQVDELLSVNMTLELADGVRGRLERATLARVAGQSRRSPVPRKLMAWVAVLVLFFAGLALVGFDNIAAAVTKVFTFIPGLGITEQAAGIYTVDPIAEEIGVPGRAARIIQAVYATGRLDVTVEVEGLAAGHKDFTLYINGELTDYRGDNYTTLARAADTSFLSFSIGLSPPADDDNFEIRITGFPEPLSFRLKPCREYGELAEIGPTAVQNGIAITATAQMVGDQLTVWCYPFFTPAGPRDKIVGFGQSANGVYDLERYIATASGPIKENKMGWSLGQRFIFTLDQEDRAATLHIPYLAMQREETRSLRVALPSEYKAVPVALTLDCSLGSIKILSVERKVNEHEPDQDCAWLQLQLDSKDKHNTLYSFEFSAKGISSIGGHFDKETGILDGLELFIDKDAKNISLDLTHLYYYLDGEYVIPLDIR